MKPIVAEFEKVPFEQFKNDIISLVTTNISDDALQTWYDELKIPMRSTADSAGHDFFTPFSFTLKRGQCIRIPTGIRVKINNPDWFLELVPRSGSGIKYKLVMANTVGIIDADYYGAKNYGHIMAELVYEGFDIEWVDDNTVDIDNPDKIVLCAGNKNHINPDITFKRGDSIFQGIFKPYGTTGSSANVDTQRVGGFGSTSK